MPALGRRCSRARRSASARAPAASARRRPRRRSRCGLAARGTKRRRADDRSGASAWPTRSGSRSSATTRARVDPSASPAGASRSTGELWAMMLDAKRPSTSWSSATRPDEESRDRILDNRIYQQISSAARRLAGVHGDGEALRAARLGGEFDLLVLDTPPTPQRARLPRRPATGSPSSSRAAR